MLNALARARAKIGKTNNSALSTKDADRYILKHTDLSCTNTGL